MELIKTTVKVGNSAGVLLPKKYLNSQVKIILEPLNIEKDVIEILMDEKILDKIMGIYIIGSYAREEQTIESDIDILVITFDLNESNTHRVTLGGNRTLALTNVSYGQKFITRLTQDTTGSRTVTWFNDIHWADGGTAPTLTTTAHKTDVFGFICTAVSGASAESGDFDGFIIGQDI